MAMKQQAAVEFIITYSWAILAISIFVITVFLLSGTRPPQNYIQSTCSIQPLIPCTESLLGYNYNGPMQYYVVFKNELGSVLYFPSNSINVTVANIGSSGSSHSLGDCVPNFASEGSTVLCSAAIGWNPKPSIGSRQIMDFVIAYNICGTDSAASCEKGLYKSSGYSIQGVAPVGISINNVEFSTDPASSGVIVLGGIVYFDGTSAYMASGNYIIYAQPGSEFKFSSWGANAPVADHGSQNTTLILTSNAVVSANFISG